MATAQTGAGDPKRSLELLWSRTGPPAGRPGPKPRFTLEQVVASAIGLADREGIAALNMRAVAAELGTGPMTLYRYVPGKSELLDLMVDTVSAPDDDLPSREELGWREFLRRHADDGWDAFIAHPWLLELNQSRPVLGPGTLASYDHILSAFDGMAIPSREINMLFTGFYSLIAGTAQQYLNPQASPLPPASSEEEWWSIQEPYLVRAATSGEFPRVGGQDDDAWSFEGREAMRLAVDAFLDGIGARYSLDASDS